MAGYGRAEMVRTPWGNADELRGRKLNPGLGVPRAEVERSQRERLFGAVVATTVERGYEATTVADLLALSGVSRASFYEHFGDKADCFAAATRELLELGTATVSRGLVREGPWEERARKALQALLELIGEEPAASRTCLVEAYRAGPEAAAVLGGAREEASRVALAVFRQLPGRAEMPPELAAAIVGGVHAVLYRRLQRGETAELGALGPGLWDWAMSYPPPPAPLGVPGRRAKAKEQAMPPFVAHVPGERVIRGFAAAVAEKGYAATTIADIAAAASISQATFYEHFANKREALSAALDSSGAQLIAATLPAVRRAADWPAAMRTAMASICGFFAAEPAFARLLAVEVYAVGPEAVAERDRASREILEVVLAIAFEEPPRLDSIAVEAMSGAVNSIFYERIDREGSANLAEIVPLATYIALAPLVGAETAYAVASGGGHGINRVVAESVAPPARSRSQDRAGRR